MRDLRRIAVNHLQALGDVQHADTGPGRRGSRPMRHADAIIFHLDNQAVAGVAAADMDAASVHLRREAMLDGVLHQRLQDHAGHEKVERGWLQFLYHFQLVTAEARDLDVEIIVEEFELLAQRHERISLAQQAAQNVAQLHDHLARRIGIARAPATKLNSAC